MRPAALGSSWLFCLRLRLRLHLHLRLRLRLRLPPGRLRKKRRKLRKWNPGGAEIDPRGSQNGFLEASGGFLGGQPGRSETGSGRLLGRS